MFSTHNLPSSEWLESKGAGCLAKIGEEMPTPPTGLIEGVL
jgi:hypothetical protein